MATLGRARVLAWIATSHSSSGSVAAHPDGAVRDVTVAGAGVGNPDAGMGRLLEVRARVGDGARQAVRGAEDGASRAGADDRPRGQHAHGGGGAAGDLENHGAVGGEPFRHVDEVDGKHRRRRHLERPDGAGRLQEEAQQAGRDLADDALGVRPGRAELPPGLDADRVHLRPERIDDPARIGVVGAGAGGRVEAERGRGRVGAPVHRLDGCADLGGERLVDGEMAGVDVFAVGVGLDAPGAVERRVQEVLRRVGGLILVVAPVVKDQLGVAVEVEEPADVRMVVEHPDDVLGLPLGVRRRPVVDLSDVAGVGRDRRSVGRGREVCLEVEQEIVVAVEVDADAARIATALSGVAVAAPALGAADRVVRFAEVEAVGVRRRQDVKVVSVEDGLDLRGRVVDRAITEAGAEVVGLEEIGGERQAELGRHPLAGVQAAEQEDAEPVAIGPEADGAHGPSFGGRVRQENQSAGGRICRRESGQAGLDLREIVIHRPRPIMAFSSYSLMPTPFGTLPSS